MTSRRILAKTIDIPSRDVDISEKLAARETQWMEDVSEYHTRYAGSKCATNN